MTPIVSHRRPVRVQGLAKDECVEEHLGREFLGHFVWVGVGGEFPPFNRVGDERAAFVPPMPGEASPELVDGGIPPRLEDDRGDD